MKACVFTLGCKVNQCESAALMAGLAARGYEVTARPEKADLYFLNTCAVTAEAEKKSRQAVARLTHGDRFARVFAFGCAAEKSPASFEKKDGVVWVSGARDKEKILSELEERGFLPSAAEGEAFPVSVGRARAYVKVQDGCENFCSYCIIPYLRGACRSRDRDEVRREVDRLRQREVVLTGINLSAFDREGEGLAGLLRALKGTDKRIRLSSLEVRAVDEEFLAAAADLGASFCPHFHLSLQSGSADVLRAMNRKYTPEEYYRKVEAIRAVFPDAGITTDVIAGFPAETEENFRESAAFLRAVRFSDVHCFPFSPREGTRAAEMEDLPAEVKHERLGRLLEVKKDLKADFVRANLGKIRTFLPEELDGSAKIGYTENYLKVFVAAETVKGEEPARVRVLGPYRDGAAAEIAKGE